MSSPRCRIDTGAFVVKVSGSRPGCRPSRGACHGAVPDRFQRRVVPDLTSEQIRDRGTAGRAVIAEMTAAGVFVFGDGGLDASTAVCSVDPSSGSPVFSDGPFVETKEHLGGFAVVDVPDEAAARYWAGRIAVAVGWPQELHRFPHRARAGADDN